MRFTQILRHQIPRSLAHLLLFANNSDASATTWPSRFHDIHILVITHFSLIAPSFVVFRKEIGCWANLKVFTMSPSLSLHVSPQVALVTNVPSSCKMVQFLKLIHVFELWWSYQTCPKAVPSCSIAKSEACKFKCIHNTIISMCRIVDFESQGWVRFKILLGKFLYRLLIKCSCYL